MQVRFGFERRLIKKDTIMAGGLGLELELELELELGLGLAQSWWMVKASVGA